MYAKPLTLHKGVDNVIQFQFINQEQKPIDISNKEIVFRFLNYNGTTVLIKKLLTMVLPLTGIAQLELTSADIEDFDPQDGFYSLEIPVNNFDLPVFVDADSGARGKMSLVSSVLPNFVPSMGVTIPSHPVANTENQVTYYSSQINTNGNPILTFQQNYNDYTGTVLFQGSTTGNDWYDISTEYTLENFTDTKGYTFEGFHPVVRIKYVSTGGKVDKILVR